MELLKDIYRFYSYLNLVDVIFLVAVITLLILIITLIYFIKINKSDKNDNINQNNHYKEISENSMNMSTDDNIHYDNPISSIPDDISKLEEFNDENEAILDLGELTEKLKEEDKKDRINFTEYEKEQEDKAIISYEELVEKHNKYAINYETEEILDDLVIKKIDLNDLENKNLEDNHTGSIKVLSYHKEEDFLKALKELNSLLN